MEIEVARTQLDSATVKQRARTQTSICKLRSTFPLNMKRDARVVAETPGRLGKVNSANTIGHVVRVFVIYEAAMISVPAVRAQIRLVAKGQEKGIFGPLPRKRQKQDLQQEA